MVTLDGAPWFVAKDVCDVLGLKNPTQALYKVEPCEKQTRTLTPNEGGIGRALINKDGLYRLAMRSDKKVARDFQDWIIKVVLPAIEKDGGYVLGEEKVVTGEPLPESHESIDKNHQSVLGRCSPPCRRTPRQTDYFSFQINSLLHFSGLNPTFSRRPNKDSLKTHLKTSW